MKITRWWILVAAFWIYFLTAIFLYAYLRIEWVKTLDALLGLAATLIFSVWFIVARLRPGKGNWTVDSFGNLHRRRVSPGPGTDSCEDKER